LPEIRAVLIAVSDAVLADSLRFSLELEGYDARVCDEDSLLPAVRNGEAAGCLVLDQKVFVRMTNGDGNGFFTRLGIPVVLMVAHKTPGALAQAKRAGVTKVVEQPLLGGVLFEAIRHALDGAGQAPAPGPC
jgi:FixJ family two-component response regulator